MPERQMARAIVVRDEQILLIKRQHYSQQFYTLPGGEIEPDETPEAAAIRELAEETSIVAAQPVMIYEEHSRFGYTRYFVCRYASGQPKLSPDSEEARFNAGGENTYEPVWVTIDALVNTPLLPTYLNKRLQLDLGNRQWPQHVVTLSESED